MGDEPLAELQRGLGHSFRDLDLLRLALTHRSWEGPEPKTDNERLEFLGDAVLDLRVRERLLAAYPGSSEGELTRLRGWMVSARNLAWVAQRLDLGRSVRLGSNQEAAGGRANLRLLANALEAVLAAILYDAGYEAAAAVVDRIVIDPSLQRHQPGELHEFGYKPALQEWMQAHGLPIPAYRIVETRGPEHAKWFWVEVGLSDGRTARGEGSSRKSAEQEAAATLLGQLRAAEPTGPPGRGGSC